MSIEFVKFQIKTDTQLPFEYKLDKNDIYIVEDGTPGIETAEQQGLIEIISRGPDDNYKKFCGGPEPIYDNGLKFVQPSEDGRKLDILPFGDWKCQRCGHITHIPLNGTLIEPFECDNEVCHRKGPFTPLFPKDLIKPIWELPSTPIECRPDELYKEIIDYVKNYLIMKPEEYHIYALWIMASWLVDDFETCPYLLFIAPKESGKSQAIQLLQKLAYRPVVSISTTSAGLFRTIEAWNITLLIDEAEGQVRTDTESGQALYGALNGGYKRGSYAIRIENDGNNKRIPSTFDVFGFKGVASTKIVHPTLESRSIIINLAQGVPKKILIEKKESMQLRSKLLYWKFTSLKKLPVIIPESRSGRIIEMMIPLFTVSQVLSGELFNDVDKILKNKIKELERARKQEELDSPEAQIIEAIEKLEKGARESYSDEVERIRVKEIADYLTIECGWQEEQGKEKINTSVGRKLKVMGLETIHTKSGNMIDLKNPQTQECLEKL